MVEVAVPVAPPLANLRRVELVQTGRWQISSGTWQPSREDLVQAVAALDCPAVRRPVLKLGHSPGETPLWQGNPTGAPAVGWVDNLALDNQGHTLVGDFVGMPGWLGGIAASAYPDRSVEGTYDFRCQIGHTHPFVLTAVALLGVTRPGVGTLKSLQDVGRLYGVQAADGGGTQVVARFNPDQPRDSRGRWTDDLPGVEGVPERVLGTFARRVTEADRPAAQHLAADVYRSGRREGAEDLLIDLWDAVGLIDDSVVEWAVARGLPDVRTDTGDARVASRDAQIDRLAALLGEEADAVDAVEDLSDRGARDGMNELLADMWDADLLDADTVEFSVENNGAADPRKRSNQPRRVEAHLPGRHNQQTHGRRYGPDGALLRGPRRLVRTTRRQTVRAIDRTLADLAGDEAATRPGMTGGPLVDLVRSVRDGVDGGQFTPEQSLQLLSSLVFRPDVASNPRLSTALAELSSRLRDGDRRDVPEAPEALEPSVPDPGPVSPRAPAQVPDGMTQRLNDARSSDDARALLGGLTADQLRAVADEVGAAYGSGWRKQRIADSIVQVTVGFRERGDAIMRGGGGPGSVGAAVQVAAAADVHTGAMVALLPSEEDRKRLAADGGEAVDQLHVTLLFLGEAVAYPSEVRQRLVAELDDVAEVIPAGDADGFAVAVFNPNSDRRDTAIVLELGGDGLEDVHGIVTAAVEEVAGEAGLILPEQHTPWRPHVTLVYSDDLTRVVELADRTGPIRFDRLRVAFAGENVDIPLTGEPADDPDLDNLTDDDMPAVDGDGQVVAQETRRVTRSDRALRRYWLRGAGAAKIRWNTPGDWTRCVRQLRRHVRDPKGLCAVYHRAATGVWPGDRRNVGRVDAAFDPDQPRDQQGRWTDVMHLASSDEIADFRKRFGKAIPPVWTNVHIADDLDNAPLLVRGVDAKGRPQSIYSAAHTEHQAAKKFARVQALNGHLDKLDHAVERDAGVNDDAAALLLIRRLGMRPGSTRDTQASTQAYGATTLLARHATVEVGTARFDFTGKKGVHIRLETSDPVVVDAVSRRLAERSGDARLFDTRESRVRDYMHSTGVPREFLLKDLRTVHANALALREIESSEGSPGSMREFQTWRRQVATVVSAALGNTPTLALSSYINPTVFGRWVRDPAWVAAAPTDLDISRAEEQRLLAGWFATVTFDRPETGIPAVASDPDDEDDDGRPVAASTQEAIALPNPNPTIIHAAAKVSVDDVRTAFYRQAPNDRTWIREFRTEPQELIVADDGSGRVARVAFDIDEDGTVRFSQPKKVRVEYVEDEDDTVAASRMVYASAAESRPSVVQAHASHNQKDHGNWARRGQPSGSDLGGGERRGKGGGNDAAIRNAYDALARGEGASIDAAELDALLGTLTGGGDEAKRANLAHLNVGGYGTLFATDKDGALDRSKMPQLGTNEQEMRPFLNLLRDRGVPVRIAEIDPTTLKPSQSEISGAKTGKLYGFMAKDGWLPGGLLVTSGDGYVVDGHHRWSGAAAVRAAGVRPDMTVTGLIVDAPIDEVLRLAQSVATFESLDFDREASGQRVAAAGFRPASVTSPPPPPGFQPAEVQAAGVSNRPWSDYDESDYTPEQWRRATLLDRGPEHGDENTKSRYGLPVREPGGTVNRNGVHAAAGGHGIGAVKGISPELRRQTARKIVRLYRDELGDDPPDSLLSLAGQSMSAAADNPATDPPKPPAAEPDPSPTKEDDMSLTEVRQRLGLADDADEPTILAALDELKTKVDQQPDPKQVAAAAAEKDELTKEVGLLKGQVEAMSTKLAETEAEKAATIKASVLDAAHAEGKFEAHEREQWEKDYDESPTVVARVLASIAKGTKVPVNVLGSVGNPADLSDDNLPPEPEWLDGPSEPALAGKES